VARARTTGEASVELDGIFETLAAFRGLSADLRKEANSELRVAAKTCATVLAGRLSRAAASSGVPVAARVARSIRVKSDRVPVVSIGGATKVGAGGAPAGVLVWGSEQGPKGEVNHFGVPPSSGYWIAPTVAAFQGAEAIEIYKRAVFDLQRKHGLV
jgi:hypothetical protein